MTYVENNLLCFYRYNFEYQLINNNHIENNYFDVVENEEIEDFSDGIFKHENVIMLANVAFITLKMLITCKIVSFYLNEIRHAFSAYAFF